ncbi:hypothetical protein ACFQ10_10680 [Streptomyces indonesiensis]
MVPKCVVDGRDVGAASVGTDDPGGHPVHHVGDRDPARGPARPADQRPRLADDRHQSLRASLEWSYALLNPQKQALLRRLSVLSDDFGPDAAAAIASDLPAPATAIPRLLIGLEAKSVITALTDTSGPTRFRLLESIRCFGHDRLIAEDEETGAYERLVSWLTAMCLPLHGEAVVPSATLERPRKSAPT